MQDIPQKLVQSNVDTHPTQPESRNEDMLDLHPFLKSFFVCLVYFCWRSEFQVN